MAACPKVWFRVGETLLLRGGVIFEKFEPPEAAPPQKHRAFKGGVSFLRNLNRRRQRRHGSTGLNGVGSNSNGLILWENDATRLRKVFRYLPGLREAIF